jgi:hypothetical protein
MWRSDKVDPAPDSWGAVSDPGSPYKGEVTAYDNPIYFADAALYLEATRPELGIENVYELDDADHCDVFHAGDESCFDRVAYWTTPRRDCGDDRGAVCKDYSEWVRAWRRITG